MNRLLTALLLLLLSCPCAESQSYSTFKPWTYWWWMGSSVTKTDIQKQLDFFEKSGLGGVHIIPIYGVKGFENQSISFLSPEWLRMMEFTIDEASKRGLGVDLTTGTGWPFGGPNVSAELAAKAMSIEGGMPEISLTKQKVKRAAPGGEGYVLDPFHPNGMEQYLTRFDSAFSNVSRLPRSMYMDSYEAYGANWTNDFEKEFQSRRKYALKDHLNALTDSTKNIEATLVKIDYHQTLSELLLERYAQPWTEWSERNKFLTRYQAHGSPGNLLDLYAAATIPETESFGTSRFPIPGLRVDPDYSIDQFGTPNPLAMKFASSAAHLNDKKLVSSETGTWLANHFKVSLSQIKPQIDELFTAGINHIFYHGTNYSPANEPYPGWLFYASTNFGPSSHFANHFKFLNDYVAFCQKRLQESETDNDLLIYFPIHDLWATKAKSAGNVHLLEVHHVDRWLLGLPFGKLADKLLKQGYAFDFLSDNQMKKLKISGGKIMSGNAAYKAILIPESQYMPQETVQELLRLASAGVRIIFENKMPPHATGFVDHSQNQQAFKRNLNKLSGLAKISSASNLETELSNANILKEELSARGLSFIRKKTKSGANRYFVTNLGDTFNEGWVALGNGGYYNVTNPLTGKIEAAPSRKRNGKTEIFLRLSPGQSCFLESGAATSTVSVSSAIKKEYGLSGSWDIQFLEGRPRRPVDTKLSTLQSWTTLPDSAVYFSGTARYAITFDVPAEVLNSKQLLLDLGDVRESAQVRLNGKDIGVAWCIPFQLAIDPSILKPKGNLLEIDVTNLSANYMRLRDRQQPDWKKFLDINIVDITYKKFDASKWEPMPSGLLSPVKIIY